MAEGLLFRFAVIGDIGRNNKHCMAGVSHVLTRLRKLGVRSVLFAEEREWRLVDVEEKGKSFDLGAAAVSALEEKSPAIEYVERGGFGFVLCNEKGLSEKVWTPFAEKMMERLKRAKVFFYAQIYHPAGTVAGDFVPKQDGGFSTAALSGMRNCVAFSVGARGPLSDERSIRQGDFGFTSVATSSFRYPELFPGRDVAPKAAPPKTTRPALIVSVHGDRVEFSRMLLAAGEKLGDDWVMPFGDYGALSYERRARATPAPEFAEGAKAQVRFVREKTAEGEDRDLVKVEFPRAQGTRAFEYEVTAHCLDGGVDAVVSQKRVYSPGVFLQPGAEPAKVSCPFARKELYQDVQLMFEVRAMNCFGAKGRPITCVRTVKSGMRKEG